MSRAIDRLPQGLFMLVSLSALVLCPHSKVEESFNLQATHDLYYYGVSRSLLWLDDTDELPPYDHLQYPGVVPRTFSGPLILAAVCRILSVMISPLYTLRPLQVQFLARFILLLLNWHAWHCFTRALRSSAVVTKKTGGRIARYLWLVTACQFHLPFYASRMLPNTFALVVVLHGYAFWLERRFRWAAACLVVATAVFRCDVVMLLFVVGLVWLVRGYLRLWEALQVGLVTGVTSVLVSVPLDSLFWQRWVWPEGQVFYYNTVLGKSSDWGTSPWHWYMTQALPKAMLLTMLLVPLAIFRLPRFWSVDITWIPYLVPAVGFVGLYSCLGHKEMRFLFPIMPLFNLAAAVGLSNIHQWAFPDKGKRPTRLARVTFLGGLGCLAVTLTGSLIFLDISRKNYPGGEALKQLTHHLQHGEYADKVANVWVDVGSAMSGVSLFGQREASERYPMTIAKGGYENENAGVDFQRYSHVLSEDKKVEGFHTVRVAEGHPRLDLSKASVITEEAIYILERTDWVQ